MEKQNKITNILIKIFLILVSCITLFAFSSVKAEGENEEPAMPVETPHGGVGAWNEGRNLPGGGSGETGLLPVIYGGYTRKVTLPASRYQLSTKNWTGTIDGKVIYCGLVGGSVQYGTYEDKEHYLHNGTDNLGGVSLSISKTMENQVNFRAGIMDTYITEAVRAASTHYTDNEEGYNYWEFTDSQVSNLKPVIDWDGATIDQIKGWAYMSKLSGPPKSAAEAEAYAEEKDDVANLSNDLLDKIYDTLPADELAKDYDSRTDGEVRQESEGDKKIIGVLVKVMETDGGEHNDGYGDVQPGPTATFTNSQNNASETKKAFIFSTIENAYKYAGSVASKYSLADIQSAYWLVRHYDDKGGEVKNVLNEHPPKESARELYNLACNYYQFVNDNPEKKITLDSSKAKVIANTENEKYYVGPLTIDYPYYKDICYLQSLNINTVNEEGTAKELSYNLEKQEFELIIDGEGEMQGGVKFPKKDQEFYIAFSAKDANYPTAMTIGAKMEYIESCEADYKKLETKCKIYSYQKHAEASGDHAFKTHNIKIKITTTGDHYIRNDKPTIYRYIHSVDCSESPGTTEESTEGPISCPYCGANADEPTGYEFTKKENATFTRESGMTFYQPFIQMEPYMKNGVQDEDTAQILNLVENAKRDYTRVDAETSGDWLDLTINLGGYVWIDKDLVRDGKETVVESVNDDKEEGLFEANKNEEKIGNVKVELYKIKNGKLEDKPYENSSVEGFQNPVKTKTKEQDSAHVGEYRFEKINAMYKYVVQFTYNGQYYNPTYYTSPADSNNGWGKGNWQYNSNATENYSERDTFNKKFETIKSDPNCYSGGKIYTKEELIASGAMDKYGNILNEGATGAQYVRDCQIKAYTGSEQNVTFPNSNYVFDKCPYPKIFLIEDPENMNTFDRNALRLLAAKLGLAESNIKKLYDHAYYINLGLYERPEADIALAKSLSKVQLEINGQKSVYTYKDFRAKLEADKSWTIGITLSDELKNAYGITYDREIYKSDYLYKVSDYKDSNGNSLADALGKNENDELKVFVTYKITLRNQSNLIKTRVEEIVDFFDNEYKLVEDQCYIGKTVGITRKKGKTTEVIEKYKIDLSSSSKYNHNKNLTVPGTDTQYGKVYVKGLGKNAARIDDDGNILKDENGNDIVLKNGLYLDPNEEIDLYLTFEVKKDDVGIIMEQKLGSDTYEDAGKVNIAEITGYSTQYVDGLKIPNMFDNKHTQKKTKNTVAGVVDCDSTPGNLKTLKGDKLTGIDTKTSTAWEDDTGKAPYLRLVFSKTDAREIKGNVFEDIRNFEYESAMIGDGEYKNTDDKLINGIKVQLVELMENGTEFIWRETITGPNTDLKPIINAIVDGKPVLGNLNLGADLTGLYGFKSFIPGKYVVRYIYGDSNETVITKDLATLLGLDNPDAYNDTSYNGQDYKSTIYQKGINQKLIEDGRDETYWTNDAAGDGNLIYMWRQKAEKNIEGLDKEAPILTQVSTFKDDASNNEPVVNVAEKKLQGEVGYLYDITASNEKVNVSDAKDIESIRKQVNDYSNNKGNGVKNHLAEILASHDANSDFDSFSEDNKHKVLSAEEKAYRSELLNEFAQNTKMTAETGLMVVELEYDSNIIDENERRIITYLWENTDIKPAVANETKTANQVVTDLIDITGYDVSEIRAILYELVTEHNQIKDLFNTTAQNQIKDWKDEKDELKKKLTKDLENESEKDAAFKDYCDNYYIYHKNIVTELIKKTSPIRDFDTLKGITGYASNTLRSIIKSIEGYLIDDVDFGLVERPKAQLEIEKEVKNVNITLSDGSIAFDAEGTTKNVLWNAKPLEEKQFYQDKFKFIKNLEDIKDIMEKRRAGLIQITMDEELMHGATIKVNYDINVKNVGEVDYKGNMFYYTGKLVKDETKENKDETKENNIIKTTVNKVIDYVTRNLKFDADINDKWTAITDEEIYGSGNKDEYLVNERYKEALKEYSTKIVTKADVDLVPYVYSEENSETAIPLTLSQTITSENDSDDLTYKNLTEIIETSNDVGRRMAYSIVGNQNPEEEAKELDADRSSEIKILPPFGDAGINITIALIVLVSVSIVIVGIVFIKKKVLKK